MPHSSFSRVKETFEQWAMYDAVIRADYMRHAELVATLSQWAREQQQPLRIVDLGCGDAWLATHSFREAKVEQYRGVDVSNSAVERARNLVAIWPGRADVVAGNLAEFLRAQPDESANVVLASYSLHHFLSDQKTALIVDCGRVLAPGGSFIWIDAVRGEDESRQAYIDRLTLVMQHDWTALTEEQRARACNHVRESDFPEKGRWMRDQVERAGFQVAYTILHDEFFAGWVFTEKVRKVSAQIDARLKSLTDEHAIDFSVRIALALHCLQLEDPRAAESLEQLTALISARPLDEIPAGRRPNSRHDVPVTTGPSRVSKTPAWSNWWLLVGLVGILTAEWCVRRSVGRA